MMTLSRTVRAAVAASILWIIVVGVLAYVYSPEDRSGDHFNSCADRNFHDEDGDEPQEHEVAAMMKRDALKSEIDAYLTSWGFGEHLHVLKPDEYKTDSSRMFVNLRLAHIRFCDNSSKIAREKEIEKYWLNVVEKALLGLIGGWMAFSIGIFSFRWIMRGS